jgi:isopentenyl diphosphate isomerase/L-lactate dehydrogenase-like FMN-dependent dehydrogenase
VAFALPALRAVAKGGKEELSSFLDSYIFEMKVIMAALGLNDLKTLKAKGHYFFWVENREYRKL